MSAGTWDEGRAWLGSLSTLLRSGAVLPGSVATVRDDGRQLAAEVRAALTRVGVAPAAVERHGPRIVVVHLPPAWPAGWDVAPLLRVHGATARQDGGVIRVRR